VYIPCRLQLVRTQARNVDKVSKDQVTNSMQKATHMGTMHNHVNMGSVQRVASMLDTVNI